MTKVFEHGWATLVGLTCVMVVVAFDAGDALLLQLHAGVGHHALHLALPVVAFLIFASLAARDVRRHGWPEFSWRL